MDRRHRSKCSHDPTRKGHDKLKDCKAAGCHHDGQWEVRENATQIGSIPGMTCDLFGNKVDKVTLADVIHLPNGKYNLFSMTKMTQKGWTLGDNADALWLTKGSMKIMFDIKIPTPKGVLFAMYHARDHKIGGAAAASVNKIPIAKAHRILGMGMSRLIAKQPTLLDGPSAEELLAHAMHALLRKQSRRICPTSRHSARHKE